MILKFEINIFWFNRSGNATFFLQNTTRDVICTVILKILFVVHWIKGTQAHHLIHKMMYYPVKCCFSNITFESSQMQLKCMYCKEAKPVRSVITKIFQTSKNKTRPSDHVANQHIQTIVHFVRKAWHKHAPKNHMHCSYVIRGIVF